MKKESTSPEKGLLDRRKFLGSTVATGFSLMAAGGLTLTESKSAVADDTSSPALSSKKAWAKQFIRGGEAFILPSMMPDFKSIDEEGVRNDVRHSIAQGFCSIMPLPIGIDAKTDLVFQKVVADEAKNKILKIGLIRPGKWKDVKKAVRLAESQGSSHAMMYFNPQLTSQEAIYNEMKEVIENTSMGIIIYAKPSANITHLDPTGLPLDAFDKLANLDSVIGVKFTQTMRTATIYAVSERVGDRLLLGIVDIEQMLPLSDKYKMQWTGQWAIDSLQSPQTPWVNQFLELLRLGKNKEATELYWRYEPIASHFYALQLPSLSIGGHPWVHIKYMKWLTGGNGGLLADLNETADFVPHLNSAERVKCREVFERVGIKTTDLPDDAFVVGNAAYERGVRAKDLPALPQYIA